MKAFADRIGVTHADGRYYFTDTDFLNEGADVLLELGTRVIKVWGTTACYPFNTTWPEIHSLTELFQTWQYRCLFSKPFTTFIIEAFPIGVSHAAASSDEQRAETERQFYDATAWLLKTYDGTGKTFILQNWEGDWAIRPRYEIELDPTPEAIQGMIATINARQAGVNRARMESKVENVFVYHAAEANLVKRAMGGYPSVANDVFPKTRCDLYSYSAWDTLADKDEFRQAVLYLRDKAPASDAFGKNNVMIGEFGWPEANSTPEKALEVCKGVIDVCLELDVPYAVHWELYCNERRDKQKGQAYANNECTGFWLIRQDGTKTLVWEYLEERMRDEG